MEVKEMRISEQQATLEAISTKSLVEELKKREGVEATIVEPYKQHNAHIEGPAIVMIVTD